MHFLEKLTKILTTYFAVWVILISIAAYFAPDFFLPIRPYISILLGIIMFGMGMTLRAADFKMAFLKPLPIILGVFLQFLIMPALGFLLAVLLRLPPEIAAGIVLVGSCPGGTASNVMVFLSRGNVALSIAMTTISTLLAPLLTPYLVLFYARRWMPIDPTKLFVSIVTIVLVPVVLGITVKKMLPKFTEKAGNLTPSISIIAIMLIIACVVALNVSNIITMALAMIMAVVLHNAMGLILGYWIAYFTKQDIKNCRAISIEVGMQNSGLGAVLAHTHFTPMTALPSVVFSIWHNISGAILASIWSRKPIEESKYDQKISD